MTDLLGPQVVRGTAVNPQLRPGDTLPEKSKVSVGANADLSDRSRTPKGVEWRHGTVVVY